MRILHTLALSLTVIISCIELSSEFENNPNNNKIADVPRSKPSYSPDRHKSPSRNLPSSRSHAPARNSAPPEPSLRARSISPPGKPMHSKVLGIRIKEFQLYRFLPINNPGRVLKLQTYTFLPGTQLYLQGKNDYLTALPSGVEIVLSAANGDVFALLEKTKLGYTFLRGLYMPFGKTGLRAKLNIFTQNVKEMNKEEINDTPLGIKFPIRKWFNITRVDTTNASQALVEDQMNS